MATAKPISPTSENSGQKPDPQSAVHRGSRPGRRRMALGLLVVLGVFLALYWQQLSSYAETGTSYGARIGCSCRYVGGRTLSDCRKDFEPGMELVRLSEDEDAQSVTARFPLVSTQTATFRKGEGCVLEPWAE